MYLQSLIETTSYINYIGKWVKQLKSQFQYGGLNPKNNTWNWCLRLYEIIIKIISKKRTKALQKNHYFINISGSWR